MQENLVIVESPAKAKTIEKFLGKDFVVKSCNGHIRDLKKKDFGIDISKNYAPVYEISPEKKKIVGELKKIAKQSKVIWLASDEDREGEAIAWHLSEALDLKKNNTKRIVFHEITKDAIIHAIKNPRGIDLDLVSAQQARRILDRLVGFELSPVLWKKVKPALSAGRVQSVAVRLIVEREREVHSFKTDSAFKITAVFKLKDKKGNLIQLAADFTERLKTEEEVEKFLKSCIHADFIVSDVQKKPSKKSPAPPFTTSTLQQEASRKLGFSVSQTMTVAQALYEAGYITYMRTDSVNLSDSALDSAKKHINAQFGDKYYQLRKFKSNIKGAQEAHEGIRPSYMEQENISGNYQEQRLYELIWKRTIASQMADAQIEKTNITINCSTNNNKFVATGELIKFDGFLKVYHESTDEENGGEKTIILPEIEKNTVLDLQKMDAIQRFSKYPARYTEASLVKKLEELGIGRPSTYAPTISTIQKRGYVIKEDREGVKRNYFHFVLKDSKISKEEKSEIAGYEKAKLFPTDIGIVVNDFLIRYFDNIIDYNFTAEVEEKFDEIALGKLDWTKMIDKFYHPFHQRVESTLQESEFNTGERVLGKDPQSGKVVLARIGRFGPIVQLGDAQNGDQPVFASLGKNQLIETITLDEAITLLKNNKDGRKLGIDPQSGKPVFVRVGRFGPMVQIGESDDKEKPRYASLLPNQDISKLDLEQALKLFSLPRGVGDYNNLPVTIGTGRFGPYIRYNSKFTSLKKNDDPLTITLERAVELIEAKQISDEKRIIKSFDNEKDIIIMKDRWGKPCIKYKTKYLKIPKGISPEELTLEKCREIIDAEIKPASAKKKRK
ncbi:MAG: type I DNA topoisomerase [Bacteroidales bacterium]